MTFNTKSQICMMNINDKNDHILLYYKTFSLLPSIILMKKGQKQWEMYNGPFLFKVRQSCAVIYDIDSQKMDVFFLFKIEKKTLTVFI